MRPGDPAFNDEAMRPGQAWVRVRRNRLSCGRNGSRRNGDRSDCRPLEAHADERTASALEALDLPDPTIGTQRTTPWSSHQFRRLTETQEEG